MGHPIAEEFSLEPAVTDTYDTLRPVLRYGLAIAAVAAALGVSLLFYSTVENSPFLLMWPAVVLASLYGGLGPGLLAGLLAALAVNFFMQEPRYTITFYQDQVLPLGVFALLVVLINRLYESRRVAGVLNRRQREWLHITLDSIGDGVIATDAQGCVLLLNPVAEKLTGWRSSEAYGQPIQAVFRIINEDTRAEVPNPVAQVLARGAIAGLANHTLLVARDGSERPIDDSASPIKINGAVVGTVLVFRDSSRQRRTQQELRESERRAQQQLAELEAIYDSAPVGLAVLDSDLRFVRINKRMAEFNGASVETHQGRTVREIAPGISDAAETFLRRILEAGEPVLNTEVVGQTPAMPGIERVWIESWLPLCDSQGKITAVNVVANEVTDLRRAERSEREQRRLAEALWEATQALNSSLDLDVVLDNLFYNTEHIVPFDAGAVLLCSDGIASVRRTRGLDYDPELRARAENLQMSTSEVPALHQMVESGQPLIIPDIRQSAGFVYPEGAIGDTFVNFLGTPIFLRGEIIGFVALFHKQVDFFTPVHAERLRLFAEHVATAIHNAHLYQQAQTLAVLQERERLARDLHDAVSQTLFSANMLAEALPQLMKKSPDKALDRLAQIHRLTRGAQAEMRTLLLELRPAALLDADLSDLLPQLLDAIRSRKLIHLDLQLEANFLLPPEVKIAFYRIIQEALNNVVKHSQATQASIRLWREGDSARLCVTDNGRGFDLDAIAPTSLGLRIMRERADSVAARLEISTGDGEGTSINVAWTPPPVPERPSEPPPSDPLEPPGH